MVRVSLAALVVGVSSAFVGPAARLRVGVSVRGAEDEGDGEKPMTLYELETPCLNKYSSTLTSNKKQGASQAMLYATGLEPEDMKKAQVGVGSIFYDGNPCNMHLLELGTRIRASSGIWHRSAARGVNRTMAPEKSM